MVPSKAVLLALLVALAMISAPRVSADRDDDRDRGERERCDHEEGESKTCQDEQKCCVTNSQPRGNRVVYAKDEQCWKDKNGDNVKGSNELGYLPLICTLPEKFCNCSTKVWRVAPWVVKTPVPSNYLDRTPGQSAATGANPKPYNYGILSRDACCKACQGTNNGTNKAILCAYWLHYSTSSLKSSTGVTSSCASSSSCGYCIIFPPGAGTPTCSDGASCKNANAGNNDDKFYKPTDYATVGKGCAGGKNDPHFVGAGGVHFDFNGVPDQSFCLVTDPKFQINMKMRGYYDSRTIGASVLSNGMAVRTWIKDLGIMWTDPVSGVKHTLKLAARDGKEQARGLGYMGVITIDGADLPGMKVGESINGPAGLEIHFTGYEKEGGGFFDVDVFEVRIAGMMSVEVKLRIAHPLLQTADDAMTHINVRFMYLEHSTQTHGVLGQTFRSGRERRTIDYNSLSALIGRDLPADSDVAKGFLDGLAADYKTSSVLASDCVFSAYNGQELPAAV